MLHKPIRIEASRAGSSGAKTHRSIRRPTGSADRMRPSGAAHPRHPAPRRRSSQTAPDRNAPVETIDPQGHGRPSEVSRRAPHPVAAGGVAGGNRTPHGYGGFGVVMAGFVRRS